MKLKIKIKLKAKMFIYADERLICFHSKPAEKSKLQQKPIKPVAVRPALAA